MATMLLERLFDVLAYMPLCLHGAETAGWCSARKPSLERSIMEVCNYHEVRLCNDVESWLSVRKP